MERTADGNRRRRSKKRHGKPVKEGHKSVAIAEAEKSPNEADEGEFDEQSGGDLRTDPRANALHAVHDESCAASIGDRNGEDSGVKQECDDPNVANPKRAIAGNFGVCRGDGDEEDE